MNNVTFIDTHPDGHYYGRMERVQRIGMFAGTFDPVHQGHLAFCERAMAVCGLDEIMLVPERRPRGKVQATELAHRVALLQHATAGLPRFRVVTLASERFTVRETLPELRTLVGDAELTLLVGSDIVPTMLEQWPDIDLLLREMSLAVGLRDDASLAKTVCMLDALSRANNVPVQYSLVTTEHRDLASSLIRTGRRAAGFTPAMAAYIQRYDLYPQVAP